jgi:aspartyl/glutamyl-tRNA(Asn/Gln) amidotransferase C subunit
MTESITPEVFSHLAQLAAFELPPEEAEYLRQQLNNQLKAVRELVSIPIGQDVPPSTHGVTFSPEISPPIRPDEWLPFPFTQEILSQVPEKEDGYIVVPETPHTELES